ncbi:cell division protein FtsN [Bacillus sp. CH30_1T]|uniref:CalY family protein n=1 Tax=Bacillus sp. CH30_1T TaxID=2604836 RepID=UPI0011EF61C1|nr:CalY family protein [Bacillus sp. CH30_1T]KAA0563008.1 cell division protein FtsN [Bacillus sp. CH30_1T]
MGIKQKLGLGVASAVLGVSLIGGGTYAYFSDTAETSGTFASGTIELNANPTTIIDVHNIKPGDTMLRSFELKNDGTLDIASLSLATSYTVNDVKGDNDGADFGKHIRVNFLVNADKLSVPIFSTTLQELQGMSPDVIQGSIFSGWLAERGGKLKAGTSDTLFVQYEFVENDKDQNIFQGDTLELEWTFEGKQGRGEAK